MIAIRRWKLRFTILISAALFSICIVSFTWLRTAGHWPSSILQYPISHAPHTTAAECDSPGASDPPSACFTPTSKYSYATILTGYNGTDSEKYFTAVRLLTYQLVHDPRTRAQNGIRFTVLVTEDVPQENREILQHDGAVVLPVDSIAREWIHPKWARWSDVMAKLNLWTLTDYDKIVFMDADTVVLQRLDDIFLEPATIVQQTSPPTADSTEDDGLLPVPETYMIAGIHDRWVEQYLPPDPGEGRLYARNNYMNAGFFVLSPSQEMFEYYLALLDIANKLDMTYPEQNLLNYAHRTDGRMPWTSLGSHWNAMTALNQPFAHDVQSLHHKWWQKLNNQTVNNYISETMKMMIALYNFTSITNETIN